MKLINGVKNQGFTLIELLIVVVILGVLAAVAIPQFTASTDDAKQASLDSTLATTRTAIDMYFQDHSEYPGASAATGDVTAAADTQAAFEAHLTKFTDAAGDVSNTKDATHIYGPYLKKALPADPYMGASAVAVVTAGSLDLNATGTTTGGWKYDSVTGSIIMNHEDHDDR